MTVKTITDYAYFFSRDNKPAIRVEPDTVLKFKTLDCFSNQVESEDQLITSIDFNRVNPGTGPVYVEGAEKGDVLVVEIMDIEVGDKGVVATLPGMGPLQDNTVSRTKVLDIENGRTRFNDVEFDIEPMIGVIGVAPEAEPISCGMWGPHGGNMDNNKIKKNTTLYLPVNTDGGLLQIGDLHASMGDGELCGTGIEVEGVVTARIDLIKNFELNGPLHETEDSYYTIADAETYDEAMQLSLKEMQRLMLDAYKWDETDIYMYMSIQGDIEICQGVKPADGHMVVRFRIPKLDNKPLI